MIVAFLFSRILGYLSLVHSRHHVVHSPKVKIIALLIREHDLLQLSDLSWWTVGGGGDIRKKKDNTAARKFSHFVPIYFLMLRRWKNAGIKGRVRPNASESAFTTGCGSVFIA